MPIVDTYTTAVHQNLRPYFANWEPGRPVRLGDYGPVAGYSIQILGNISDRGVGFDRREDSRTDHKVFSSEGKADLRAHARGQSSANATLEINFSDADAVFFNAAECKHSLVADKPALGREIMRRYRDGGWNRSWAIVTDAISAGATTVAVSGAKGSSLVLEADGDVELIDLAKISGSLNLRSQSNVGFHLVAQNGLTPLIGLCMIQSPFLGLAKDFNPLTLARDSEVERELQEHLFFGQLR